MQIAILLFEGLTALDAIGPYEVLSRIPGTETIFVAADVGPKRTDNGVLALVADRTIDEVPSPDVVVVPAACRASRSRWRTSGSSDGSGASTRPRRGRHRSAPAR